MPRIAVEQAVEGMKVTQNVTNADGMLLIPAGCVLGERHIALLSTWNISEIEVEDDRSGQSEKNVLDLLPPDVLDRLRQEVRGRFYQFDETNPVLQEACRLALLRAAAAQVQP